MFNSWEFLAGKKLADYSRIVDLNNNTLVIEADHPAIIQLLQLRYSEILQKLKRKYPQLEIKDMRMFLKNSEFKEGRAKSRENLPGDEQQFGSSERKEVDLNKIENEKFRTLLLSMKKRSQV